LLRTAVIGTALWLWIQGQATAGDLTFVLTSFFLLQGYLRDVGVEIRHLQKAVNDMEELADIERHPLGIEDRIGAQADPRRRWRDRVRSRHVPLRQPPRAALSTTSR
jgi:ATP-binding cassette subfamily B protein